MRGDYPRARTLFTRSLELKEKIGDLYDLVVAYNNLAEVELITGEVESALDKARRALQVAEAIGARDALADIYRNYAEALRARGDSVGAVRAAERAFECALEPGNNAYLPLTATTLANCFSTARDARQTLSPEQRTYVDDAVNRTLDRVPKALTEAGLEKDATAFRSKLSA
jgi:tetratricopeptide (TPR) repeat protein